MCCYAKIIPYVLPKFGFITPPYCQHIKDKGGLIPNFIWQTIEFTMSCCGYFLHSQ